MKKLLLLNIFFLSSLYLCGQVTFEKSYYEFTPGSSEVVFLQNDGYLMPATYGDTTVMLALIKTDLNGDTVWTKKYNFSTTSHMPVTGADDADGNIYLCFFNKLVKFDKFGTRLWDRPIIPMQDMVFSDNAVWTSTYSGVYKYDPVTGDSLWRSGIVPVEAQSDILYENNCLAITESGEIILSVLQHNLKTHDLLSDIYKISASTGQIDTLHLQTEQPPVIADLISSGNEIIAVARGQRMYSNSFTYFRFTTDGTVIAMKKHTHNGLFDWRPYHCILNNDNQVVILGRAMGTTPETRIILHCLSMSGDSLWSATTGRLNAKGYDIKATPDNGLIIAGELVESTQPFYTNRPHLIKTTSQGVINAFEEKTTPNSVKQIYPNPASGHIVFELQQVETGIITIHNSTGGLCAQIPFSGKRVVYDTQSLKPGFYFLKINSDDLVKGRGKFLVVSSDY